MAAANYCAAARGEWHPSFLIGLEHPSARRRGLCEDVAAMTTWNLPETWTINMGNGPFGDNRSNAIGLSLLDRSVYTDSGGNGGRLGLMDCHCDTLRAGEGDMTAGDGRIELQ